jgi:hypothetical protein
MDRVVYGDLLPNGSRGNNGFIFRILYGPYTHGNAYVGFYNSWIGQLNAAIAQIQAQVAQLQNTVPPPSNLAQQVQSLQAQIPPIQAEIDELTVEKRPYELFRDEALRLCQQIPYP